MTFPEALTERFPKAAIAINLGLQSYVAVCLRSSDDVHLGHLAVLDTRPMEAREEDAAALRIFAARASAELERRNQARALEESRARVIEAADRERRRVGRDLHDGAQQRLLAVSNLLRVSRMKLDESDPAPELIARAEEELSQAHAELRKLARGLHPVALSERGLGSALESLCARLRRAGRRRDLRRRAAAAGRARRVLRRGGVARQLRALRAGEPDQGAHRDEGESLLVEVSDDGVGGADPTCGTGLLGLADRVEVLGGRLEVDSPLGDGTRVRDARSPRRADDRPPALHRLRRGQRAARRRTRSRCSSASRSTSR